MNKKLIGRAILKDNYGERGYEPIFFVSETIINDKNEIVEVPIMPFFYSRGS